VARPKKKGATIAQIAAECGVSPATVSRVLYKRPHVDEDVRLRVLDEIKRSNYQFLHTSRAGKVLVLTSDATGLINGEYYYELLNALHAILSGGGYTMIVAQASAFPLIGNGGYDAIISLGGLDDVMDYWSSHLVVPLIYVNRLPERAAVNCFSVSADHRQSIRDAVDLLCKNGHRRIGFLNTGSGKEVYWRVIEEEQGFREAVARQGLPLKGMIAYTHNNEPHQALTELLRQNITALICPNITEGGKVAHILQDLRWNVPDDCSVIVGDSEFYNRVNAIPLTAIRMPSDKIAEHCLNIIQGETDSPPPIPYEIINRGSVKDLTQ
jgi:LacI family transcriptional regulator